MLASNYDERIVQNLHDAGCDNEEIDAFMSNFHEGNKAKATKLLQKHRCSLLADLHNDQRRIDYLDYLVFILQK